MKLQEKFNYINNRLFDGLLDMPVLLYIDNDDVSAIGLDFEVDGLFHAGIDNIPYICIHEDSENKLGTLIHEMIHLWQWENKKPLNHSGWFRVWVNRAFDEFY